jgi:hypothetical protein
MIPAGEIGIAVVNLMEVSVYSSMDCTTPDKSFPTPTIRSVFALVPGKLARDIVIGVVDVVSPVIAESETTFGGAT